LKTKSIVVLHFNVIEKYPPVLNFLRDFNSQRPEFKIYVFTTYNNSKYSNFKTFGSSIYRFGIISFNFLFRYLTFLFYNGLSFFCLLLFRPEIILVYETFSVFPAFIYSKVYKKTIIHLHFHEYVSLSEKKSSSLYMKFLFYCEQCLLKVASCSHTNDDRKFLQLRDSPGINSSSVLVFPYFPPYYWWENYGIYKKKYESGCLKLLYIGSLDSETMYLEQILSLVKSHPFEVSLTLFCPSISATTKNILELYKSSNISLNEVLDYDILPSVLIQFDVGLVLYKGHIPNYVFNVPNKVYEYLSCGLHILVDRSLITSTKLGFQQVLSVNFMSLDLEVIKSHVLNVPTEKPDYSSFKSLVTEL
jgi:hypothetical protein